MNSLPPVTKHLLIINVLAFLGTLVLQGYGVDLGDILGLHFFLASEFHCYQFVTYMFVHGGWMHLFFNMFALWMFGRIMEQVLGSRRFATLYFVCGVGAGLMQELVQWAEFSARGLGQYPLDLISDALNTWSTMGASGAVYGILLAFGMTFPNERLFIIPIPFPIRAKYFVGIYAVIELMSALLRSADGVAHVAHLGGMLFALGLVLWWRKPRRRWRGFNWHKRRSREEEIERIMNKVNKRGYGSLTESERRKLFG